MSSNKKLLTTLSGLPDDVTILDSKRIDDDIIEIFVKWDEPKVDDRNCPSCGSTWCVKKDAGRNQTLRHTPSGIFNLWLTFHVPRYKCRECGRTFNIKPWWAQLSMSISLPLFYLIYKLLVTTTMNLSDIAKRTNSTRSIVQNVMDKILLDTPGSLPSSIGIDEFHGSTGRYDKPSGKFSTEKYHCVITDTDKCAVFDIVIDPRYKTLRDYFKQYHISVRKQVRFISMDMRSGFSRVARECFPYARICIDPFHVVKLLTEAVSRVRIDEWRRHLDIYKKYLETISDLSPQERKDDPKRKLLEHNCSLIKNSQKVLVASPFNDSYWSTHYTARMDKLEEIFTLSPDLMLPHEALMDFYDVEESSDNLRHESLNEWLKKYLGCECPPIKQAAASISKRKAGIERAWKYHKSNAKTEGLNKKIKDINRAGFGMHDFDNFMKRILLSLGYDHFIEPTYTIHRKRAEALCNKTTKGGNEK